MKGDGYTYRPEVGERCLISPPHSDDNDGYCFQEYEILWKNGLFVLYGNEGCWPNLNKWRHIIAKATPKEASDEE